MNRESDSNFSDASGWVERLCVPLGLLVLALPGIRTISHADFWTHLATGRWTSQHGVPRTDMLTWVSEGATWVHGSWLYDLALFRLWQLGGAGLVTLLHVAILVATFYLLVRLVRPHASALAIGWALLISAWLLAPRFEIRPSLLCMIFPALYLYVLSAPRNTWLPFALLIPAQILWANLDASFLWGPIITLLCAAQAYFQPLEATARRSDSLRFVALTLALLGVSMVNPYGPAIFSAAIALWTAPLLLEWISPISGQFVTAFARHMITLGLLIGALGLLTRRDKLPIAWTGIAIISAFLVVHSMPAHIALFAIFAFPFFCLSLQSTGEFVRERITGSAAAFRLMTHKISAGLFVLFVSVSLFMVVTNRYFVHTGHFSSFGLGSVTNPYPAEAQAIIERPDFPERVLNLPVDGGYLAWQHPERKVFIDQRSELHGHDVYTSLAQGLLGQTQAWNNVLAEWDPEAIILNNAWPYTPDIIRHLRTQQSWETVYFDGSTTILILGTSPHADLLNEKDTFLRAGLQYVEQIRRQYREDLRGVVRPPIPAPLVGAAAVFQSRGFYQQAAACHELLAFGAPRMFSARLNLGICQTRLSQFDEAVATLAGVIKVLPRDSHPWLLAHLHTGISLVELTRYAQAVDHLKRVADTNPQNPLGWLWLSRALAGAGNTIEAGQALERAYALDPDFAAAFQKSR